MDISAVIVAAGSSSRMNVEKSKTLLPLRGKSVIRRTLEAFEKADCIKAIVLVCRQEDMEEFVLQAKGLIKPISFVLGGKDRQESVANGVAMALDSDFVAIHDGARPLIEPKDILSVCKAAQKHGAATLGVKLKDTVKLADDEQMVESTPPRERLWQIQTPQVFNRRLYLQALNWANANGSSFTDDCQLIEGFGKKVYLQEGSYSNIKLTTREDIYMAEALVDEYNPVPRMGHGYDVHRLVPDRKLIIGGVEIPFRLGLLGHSDADVLLHAISDAILGGAGMGDIGGMFPDTDPSYAGADSLLLLKQAAGAVLERGYIVSNLDCTVVAQKPKLKEYVPLMREKIAWACGIKPSDVNVKATTEEGLGFTGSMEGISAHAVCILKVI